MTSSRLDPGSTSVRPQNPWTSPFYGSINGPGLKTMTSITPAGTFSPFYLYVQYSQFLQFKFRSHLLRQKGKVGQWVNTSLVRNIMYLLKIKGAYNKHLYYQMHFCFILGVDFLVGGNICKFNAQGGLLFKSFIHIGYRSEWSC